MEPRIQYAQTTDGMSIGYWTMGKGMSFVQILASNVIRELVAGKEFLFSDRGETALRGFEDPVKLWEVRWREDG